MGFRGAGHERDRRRLRGSAHPLHVTPGEVDHLDARRSAQSKHARQRWLASATLPLAKRRKRHTERSCQLGQRKPAALPADRHRGDELIAIGRSGESRATGIAVVVSVDVRPYAGILWDLTVDRDHSFFVGEAAWLVHNCKTTWIGPHPASQMQRRGSTETEIEDTILNPASTRPASDTRHLPDGTTLNDPATLFQRSDGSYVVRNDITGEIVQISNRNDPLWRAPPWPMGSPMNEIDETFAARADGLILKSGPNWYPSVRTLSDALTDLARAGHVILGLEGVNTDGMSVVPSLAHIADFSSIEGSRSERVGCSTSATRQLLAEWMGTVQFVAVSVDDGTGTGQDQ